MPLSYQATRESARTLSSMRREKFKIYKTAAEAVAGIPDGAKLLVGGM